MCRKNKSVAFERSVRLVGRPPLVGVYRIIDANLNRVREGLRVCEEVVRFLMDDAGLTKELKNIRHAVMSIMSESKSIDFKKLLMERESDLDVGRKSSKAEAKRSDPFGIFEANIQRVKESMRVLEEFFKVVDKKASERFKRLRFRVYTLEKKAFERLSSLCNNR